MIYLPNVSIRSRVRASVFCPNPFGCKVAAMPWNQTWIRSVSNIHRCGVCDHRALAGHPAPIPLHLDELSKRIECCPVCHWIFGTLETSGVHPEPVVPVFKSWAEKWSSHHAASALSLTPCPICAFVPFKVADSLLRSATKPGPGSRSWDLLEKASEILRMSKGNVELEDLHYFARSITINCNLEIRDFEIICAILRTWASPGRLSSRILFRKLDNCLKCLR